jgi:hypothetical protein
MRPFTLLIAVLLFGVMMMSFTPLINEAINTYNATIPSEYQTLYTKAGNESFATFDAFGNEQVRGVEGTGIVTDATSGTQILSGGFSFLVGLFQLPQKIYSLIVIVAGYLGVPDWAIGATLTFLVIGVLAGIVAIIFRLGDA